MLKKIIFHTLILGKKERAFLLIIFFVVVSHLFFGLCIQPPKNKPLSKKQIVVRTSTALKQTTNEPLAKKKDNTLPKTKTADKKKDNALPKTKTADKKKEALKQMAKSLAKLEKIQEELPKIHTLSNHALIVFNEEEGKSEQKSYIEKLSSFLQEHLELPEKGPVQMSITITPSGFIKKLKTLASESKKNQHYIEMHLPLLQCPSFLEDQTQASENTFTITFCNETH